MNKFLEKKSGITNFVTVFLIVFFITQPVLAARSSQYGSIKKSMDAILPTQDSSNKSSVISLGSSDEESVAPLNQTNMMLSQPTMPSQIIQVHVVGDVDVPGVHKTVLSTRAAEIIQNAMPTRKTARLFTIHNDTTGKQATYDLYRYYFYGDLSQNPYLRDGDVIRIPRGRGMIRVEGPVARAGDFELYYEKTLWQVLHLVGGTTKSNAKDFPIRVIRFTDVDKKQVFAVEQNKTDLKKFKIKAGDIFIVPDLINAKKSFDYSIESVPGENFVYPTSVAEVFVVGAVLNPGPYPYKSHLTVKDYVGFSGAMADANLHKVKIIRDGKKKGHSMHAKVQAGDVIYVREKGLDVFMKYVSIFSTIIGLTTSAIVLKTYIDKQ